MYQVYNCSRFIVISIFKIKYSETMDFPPGINVWQMRWVKFQHNQVCFNFMTPFVVLRDFISECSAQTPSKYSTAGIFPIFSTLEVTMRYRHIFRLCISSNCRFGFNVQGIQLPFILNHFHNYDPFCNVCRVISNDRTVDTQKLIQQCQYFFLNNNNIPLQKIRVALPTCEFHPYFVV